MTKKEAENPSEPTGEVANLLDRMRTVIDEREALAKDDKVLKKTKADIEAKLIFLSKKLGTDIFRSPRLTATITDATRYVVDTARWDDLYKWAVEHDCMHVLHKKASGAAFDEMVKAGDGVPDMVTMEDYDKVGYKRSG